MIEAKRDGKTLDKSQIGHFVQGYTEGSIPDYQASALLMAICCRGASLEETFFLTEAMIDSGDVMDLTRIPGLKIDKHSTGGVGDKLSLTALPLAAACGLKIAKISGRGLGHTGGTLDKLESIPGFCSDVTPEAFQNQVSKIGLAIVSQSATLVPADRKLYALRDVTGTVPSIPLIAASIMSKKIASGSDKILLDVTVGNGAFMQSQKDAEQLARWMVKIGQYFGKETRAILTSMEEPLGRNIGNSLEIKEAVEFLMGCGPKDLQHLTEHFVIEMLRLTGEIRTEDQIQAELQGLVKNGKAFEKFAQMVRAQGGDDKVLLDPQWGLASNEKQVLAHKTGWVSQIRTRRLGDVVVELGGGRLVKGESIDPKVGVQLHAKIGSKIRVGEPLITIYYQYTDEGIIAEIAKRMQEIFIISAEQPSLQPMILGEIRE
jgi:pyrimidine-nucleoside phosphorylase